MPHTNASIQFMPRGREMFQRRQRRARELYLCEAKESGGKVMLRVRSLAAQCACVAARSSGLSVAGRLSTRAAVRTFADVSSQKHAIAASPVPVGDQRQPLEGAETTAGCNGMQQRRQGKAGGEHIPHHKVLYIVQQLHM